MVTKVKYKITNTKGFSFINFLIALVIGATFVMIAPMFIKMSLDTLALRGNLLEENSASQDLNMLRETIKNGFIHRYEETAENIVATDKEFQFHTSYFSHDVENTNVYKIKCGEDVLTTSFPNSVEYTTFKNISSCNILYYDNNNFLTTDVDKIASVKLTFSYYPKKDELKTVIIKQKLMQES